MIDHLKEVEINIDSPAGSVFRGFSKAVVIKAKKQVIIEFRRNWVNYVSLSEHAEMTVEIGTGCRLHQTTARELAVRGRYRL